MVTICHRVREWVSPMIKPISKIQNTLSQYFSSPELLSLVFKFVDKNQQKAIVFQWFTSFACCQTPRVSASNSRTWQVKIYTAYFYPLPLLRPYFYTPPATKVTVLETNTQPPYGQFVFASTLFPCFHPRLKQCYVLKLVQCIPVHLFQ